MTMRRDDGVEAMLAVLADGLGDLDEVIALHRLAGRQAYAAEVDQHVAVGGSRNGT